VVATSLSAMWHLVLVLKMREGEGGCKCSLWWLWVVGVGSCKMQVGIERNDDIHHCRLVATSPTAMWHLVLMLKKAAGGDECLRSWL